MRLSNLAVALLTVSLGLIGCGDDTNHNLNPDAGPAVDMVTDNSDMLQPQKGCTVAEPVVIGPGNIPRIAASGKSFGITYRTEWDGNRLFRATDKSGKGLNVPVVLPSAPGSFPVVTALTDGYLVDVEGNAGWTGRSFYQFDQNGKIRSSVQNYGNMTMVQVAAAPQGGANLVWLPAAALSPLATKCDATTDIRRGKFVNGRIIGEEQFYCTLNDDPVLPMLSGHATNGNVSLLGFHWNNNDYKNIKILLFGEKGADVFPFAMPITEETKGVTLNTIGSTDEKFYVLWTEWVYNQRGGSSTQTTHLTYIDYLKGWNGDYLLPPVYKLAWNGQNFGGVYYDSELEVTTFYLLGSEGQIIDQKVVYKDRLHYLSYPQIAYSDGSWGIVAATQKSADEEVIFLNVTCN